MLNIKPNIGDRIITSYQDNMRVVFECSKRGTLSDYVCTSVYMLNVGEIHRHHQCPMRTLKSRSRSGRPFASAVPILFYEGMQSDPCPAPSIHSTIHFICTPIQALEDRGHATDRHTDRKCGSLCVNIGTQNHLFICRTLLTLNSVLVIYGDG